jgi:hypothetical protein
MRSRNVSLVVAGVMVALALVLSACASEVPPVAHPSASAKPSHGATSTSPPSSGNNAPVPAVSPVEMPADLRIYQDMEVDGFKNLPEDERIKYWAQIVAGADGMRAFAADYYRISGDPRDKLPTIISENNSPQEIGTIIAYGQRVPFSLYGEDRQKALLAAGYFGETSSAWRGGNAALAADPAGESGGAVAYNKIVDPITVASGSKVEQSNNETYVDLSFHSGSGSALEQRAYFLTTEYNGQPVTWWVIQ